MKQITKFFLEGESPTLNVVLDTYTKNYSKIKTSFYFAFGFFTLQSFTMLYFSYL